METIKTQKISNSILLFIIAIPVAIGYYASFIYNPAHAGNPVLYVLQIIADTIAIIVVGSLWLTILLDFLQPEHNRRNLTYSEKWLSKNKPTVDVFVPVSNEPVQIIEKTLTSVLEMDYPHSTYILDDANSGEIKKLAEKLRVTYFSREKENRQFAKSGNINFGLSKTHGDFFVVFDADHAPRKNFLIEILPLFENERLGLIQTPQHYVNTHNFIASGTAQAQEIFYKFVQPAKNSYNAAFCVGTNVVYRRKAIDELGGLAKRDHSEDIWTTIQLHEIGWESLYYNKILADGRAPETIQAYFRQQNRWARGGFGLFFHKNPLFNRKLNSDQRLQYFFSNFHYYTGFAILIYLFLPLIYMFFHAQPVNLVYTSEWLIHYVPYAVLIYCIPFLLLGKFQVSTIAVSMAGFFTYIQAFFSIVLKNEYKWIATEVKTIESSPIVYLVFPHILFIALSVCAAIIGWYYPADITTTLVSTIWIIINMYFMTQFVKQGLLSPEPVQDYKISNI